ncbi:hypothetical protein DAI22_11g069300 [Oryza sativa Japonica Group]|nr:hypothetical protein DAI22_11g069300 [Oryza sativa Japonica Group]
MVASFSSVYFNIFMPPLYRYLGLLLVISLHTPSCSATNDTIVAGQVLAVGEKLISRNGKFALGFFKPALPEGTANTYDETGNDSAKCMLLGGLLEAKNLELIAEPEMHIFRSDLRWCPLFGNLKSLLLNEWCVANNFWALACILKKSPVLENFTLQISKDTKSMIETEENYNVLVKPVVTSKHLKVVKVHCTEVDEGVYKIVKFLTTLNIEVIMKRMDRSTKLFSFEEEDMGSDLEEESST